MGRTNILICGYSNKGEAIKGKRGKRGQVAIKIKTTKMYLSQQNLTKN